MSVGYLILELPILVPPRDFHLDPRGRGQTRKRMKGQHARGLGKGGKEKKSFHHSQPHHPLGLPISAKSEPATPYDSP